MRDKNDFPEEARQGPQWEAIADRVVSGGVDMAELLRRKQKLREAQASPEMRELFERVRRMSEERIAPEPTPEAIQDGYSHTIVE